MPPSVFDLLHQRPGFVDQLAGQTFDVVGACQRIDHIGDARLVLQDQLRVAGNAAGKIRRQRDGFVEGIGVQALGAAERALMAS